MNRRRIIGLAIVVAGCAAIVFARPVVMQAAEDILPAWLAIPIVFAVLCVLGPTMLLAAGLWGGIWFAAILAAVAGCLVLAKVLWRRYPHSEEFAVPAIAALVLWVGSPLLLIWILEI